MYLKFWITVIGICCLVMAFKGCELPVEITKPASAAREEIINVNLAKVGGFAISKHELLNIGKK